MGTYKVRNEIETKRNETKFTKTKRNETKRNETKRNETDFFYFLLLFFLPFSISFCFRWFRFISFSFR
jgi:hypothetical protein